MRIIVTTGSVDAVFAVDPDNGWVELSGASSEELESILETARASAAGPPLWAGPVEQIRAWVDRTGYTAEEVDVPLLPSEPGRVY